MKLLVTTLLVISFGGLCLSGGRGRGREGVKVKELIQGNDEVATETRNGKAFPVFSIIRFPNEICNPGSGRNGTCYTAEECTARSGTNSGSCAQGFGVCCVFTLTCGQTTSENCTYISETSVTSTSPDPCSYTICKASDNVCRIKFDFNTFNIAAPEVGTTVAAAASTTNADAIGDCTTDSFSITSSGNNGSPVICGFNTGQHMIVDATSQCVTANFNLGATSSESRSWDIKVTQYTCSQRDDIAGPDGCLQYFTGTSGTISSFNYPTTDTVVAVGTTHLQNQNYDICFRREANRCAICFTPAITAGGPVSFGISASTAGQTAAESSTGTNCLTDYLNIPNAANAPATGYVITTPQTGTGISRICGRFFNAITNTITTQSICTQTRPFKVSFKTDATELVSTTNPGADSAEQNSLPGGIFGFSLNYQQIAC